MDANSIYRLASFFDGPYKDEQIRINPFRRAWNLAIDVIMKLLFISHLIVFFTDDESLRNELIYLKFSKSYGYRYLNAGN